MKDPVFLSEADSKGIEFKTMCTGEIIILAAHFTRIITIIPQSRTSILLSAIIDSQQIYWRRFMFTIPELAILRLRLSAMARKRSGTTVRKHRISFPDR